MSLALIVYLAGIVKGICALFFLTGIILLAVYLCWWGAKLYPDPSTKTNPPNSLAITGFLLLLITGLIPDKETLYTMVAAHTVQDIATSPKVQELGGKSLEVIEKVMDDYLKEVKPAKVEEK